MKKINLMIMCLMFSLCAIAQQEQISKVADIKLPKNAQKMDKETMISRSKRLFGNSELQHSLKTEHLYKIDDITINLWDLGQSKDDKRSLEDIKSDLLGLYGLSTNVTVTDAIVKTFKRHTFLVIKYQQDAVCYIRFMSERKNFKSLNGLIEYKKADEGKAEATVKEILNGVLLR